jgi:hypothetical protein
VASFNNSEEVVVRNSAQAVSCAQWQRQDRDRKRDQPPCRPHRHRAGTYARRHGLRLCQQCSSVRGCHSRGWSVNCERNNELRTESDVLQGMQALLFIVTTMQICDVTMCAVPSLTPRSRSRIRLADRVSARRSSRCSKVSYLYPADQSLIKTLK